jgi:hypothetical protein
MATIAKLQGGNHYGYQAMFVGIDGREEARPTTATISSKWFTQGFESL